MSRLTQALAERKKTHLYRQRLTCDGPQQPLLTVNGRHLLSFCSNDYLGLANDPQVSRALRQGATIYGVGSGASHLVCGHSRPHHELEELLADFTDQPRALLFSTGYMANIAVMTTLTGRRDIIYEDKLAHASMIDAGHMSNAALRRYAHLNVGALQKMLVADKADQPYIATDGVFSMDGDIAPLARLQHIAIEHNAWLHVDDAHGLGVVGPHGKGSIAVHGLNAADNLILVGTLGKAFGTFGAFVAGSEELIETLIQQARPYIYTTALPPAIAHATLTSVRLALDESWRRDYLHSLITRFQAGARELGLPLSESVTPIQPLVIGDNQQVLHASDALKDRGLLVSAIRPPTVPAGTARLRITLSAAHRENDIDVLLESLSEILAKYG